MRLACLLRVLVPLPPVASLGDGARVLRWQPAFAGSSSRELSVLPVPHCGHEAERECARTAGSFGPRIRGGNRWPAVGITGRDADGSVRPSRDLEHPRCRATQLLGPAESDGQHDLCARRIPSRQLRARRCRHDRASWCTPRDRSFLALTGPQRRALRGCVSRLDAPADSVAGHASGCTRRRRRVDDSPIRGWSLGGALAAEHQQGVRHIRARRSVCSDSSTWPPRSASTQQN